MLEQRSHAQSRALEFSSSHITLKQPQPDVIYGEPVFSRNVAGRPMPNNQVILGVCVNRLGAGGSSSRICHLMTIVGVELY
jgi:hypothetical protein